MESLRMNVRVVRLDVLLLLLWVWTTTTTAFRVAIHPAVTGREAAAKKFRTNPFHWDNDLFWQNQRIRTLKKRQRHQQSNSNLSLTSSTTLFFSSSSSSSTLLSPTSSYLSSLSSPSKNKSEERQADGTGYVHSSSSSSTSLPFPLNEKQKYKITTQQQHEHEENQHQKQDFIEYRRCRYEDLEEVADLMKECFYDPTTMKKTAMRYRFSELTRLQYNFNKGRHPLQQPEENKHEMFVAVAYSTSSSNTTPTSAVSTANAFDGTTSTTTSTTTFPQQQQQQQQQDDDEKKEIIVGFVDIDAIPYKTLPVPQPYLSDLAVHPSYRRRGIARCLVSQCEQKMLQINESKIYLRTLTTNDAANTLYKGLQFHIIEIEPADITNTHKGKPVNVFCKELL